MFPIFQEHVLSVLIDHKKAFITLFNETARYYYRNRVFDDFVQCAAISLHNAVCPDSKLEQGYRQIIKHYKPEDVSRFSQLLEHVMMGLEFEPHDFLGGVFMQLNLGNKHLKQFFTPWPISLAMAKMQLSDVEQRLTRQPFFTLYEPACGAGCMVIAAAEVLKMSGYNPAQHMWVSCVDIDVVAASMAYIQLSLLGIPGEVVIGDALTNERHRVMYTPVHWLGNWPCRLRKNRQQYEVQTV
ncbi:N-6 DNA methylase [Photorhabdus luminescens]|uniref:SAM-dependent DNA methyltransferase n=1 Tax=Photorhabdus luminescens subsp. sonorensis TaxID=1173677 RepID=A0A5C4RHN2_PHOLU|nr:SAM-dependent DNA methyltransferase [Photorhabdus luminescens subsp. sonorensis]